MKILVLGVKGMLGHKLFEQLKEDYSDATGYSREHFDISKNTDSLLNDIKKKKFKIVVNCIGLVKTMCKNKKDVIFINALFPHLLAEAVNSYGGKVIHISTDCVFDGKEGNYKTDSPYSADDLYGMSKALGEIEDNTNLTIRTSIIGREIEGKKRNLVEWFLQQEKCNGFTNHLWSGLTTNELAKIISKLISEMPSGIKTIASPKPITKYELLNLLKQRYNRGTEIIPFEAETNINRSLISDIKVKPIQEQIKEMD